MCALVQEFSSCKLPMRPDLLHPLLLLISLLTSTIDISSSSKLARALTGTLHGFLLLSIVCLIHSISPWWFLHSRWGKKDPAKLHLVLIRGCGCFCMIFINLLLSWFIKLSQKNDPNIFIIFIFGFILSLKDVFFPFPFPIYYKVPWGTLPCNTV